jgi:hypothetical protein
MTLSGEPITRAASTQSRPRLFCSGQRVEGHSIPPPMLGREAQTAEAGVCALVNYVSTLVEGIPLLPLVAMRYGVPYSTLCETATLRGVADDIAELLTAIVGQKTDFWSK